MSSFPSKQGTAACPSNTAHKHKGRLLITSSNLISFPSDQPDTTPYQMTSRETGGIMVTESSSNRSHASLYLVLLWPHHLDDIGTTGSPARNKCPNKASDTARKFRALLDHAKKFVMAQSSLLASQSACNSLMETPGKSPRGMKYELDFSAYSTK
ncbi:hypothetical protein OIU79_027607 [Salix purpurea]|uniref:Uncharacterized protein n=1 Tax=Salix purpurea TaxID=77065 RepID=A0A9Q1A1Z9_SALPP|nr:hypothetical protein OIU79_027607 [Salix purpurea]